MAQRRSLYAERSCATVVVESNAEQGAPLYEKEKLLLQSVLRGYAASKVISLDFVALRI